MLTLNQATTLTKGLIKWTVLLSFLAILLFIGFKIGVLVKNILYPTPLPPPKAEFGILPKIEFSTGSNLKKYNYTLDTLTGGYPNFSDRAKVFKIYKDSPDLLALQKATEKAKSNNFNSAPFRLTNNEYQWTDLSSPAIRKLRINIFSNEFSIISSYTFDSNVISGKNLPNQLNAEIIAKSFLENMSYSPEEFKINSTTTKLLTLEGATFKPASSFAETKVIRVDFFHSNIDDLTIYYPNSNESTINFYIAGGNTKAQIILANFFYQKISDNSTSYYIKTSQEAFKELKEGKAYIASEGKIDILVQDISLGYYLSDKDQDFLMPIFVFKGDNGFVAYLSAIRDEWINK